MATTNDRSSAFSLNTVYQQLLPRMKSSESDMSSLLRSLGPRPDSMDLIMVQAKMSEWTLAAQLNSGLIKELGDTLKGIVQKAA